MEKRSYYKFPKRPESVRNETFRIIGDGRMVAAEEKFYRRIGSAKEIKKASSPNFGDCGDITRFTPSKYESCKLVYDCSDDEQQVLRSMRHINRNSYNNYYRNEVARKATLKRTDFYKKINNNTASVVAVNNAVSSTESSHKPIEFHDDLKSEKRRKIIIVPAVPTPSRNIINGRKTVDFAEECIKSNSLIVKIPYWANRTDTEGESKRKNMLILKRKSFESIASIDVQKKRSYGRIVRKKSNKKVVRKPLPKEETELFPKVEIVPDCCTKYTLPIYKSWFDLNFSSKPQTSYLNRILNDAIKIYDDVVIDEPRFEERFTGKIKFNR